jgi:hypothetical protein
MLALVLALTLTACSKQEVSREAILGAIHENTHALETKDVATIMATIHPESPYYADTKEFVETDYFKSVDLKYTISDLQIISSTPEEVKVSFVQKMQKVGGTGPFVDNITESIDTMRLDGKRWKIYKSLTTKATDLQGKPLQTQATPSPTPTTPALPEEALPAPGPVGAMPKATPAAPAPK